MRSWTFGFLAMRGISWLAELPNKNSPPLHHGVSQYVLLPAAVAALCAHFQLPCRQETGSESAGLPAATRSYATLRKWPQRKSMLRGSQMLRSPTGSWKVGIRGSYSNVRTLHQSRRRQRSNGVVPRSFILRLASPSSFDSTARIGLL